MNSASSGGTFEDGLHDPQAAQSRIMTGRGEGRRFSINHKYGLNPVAFRAVNQGERGRGNEVDRVNAYRIGQH